MNICSYVVFQNMEIQNSTFDKLVDLFTKLPTIGKKTAQRLVLHLIKSEKQYNLDLSDTIKELSEKIKFCKQCYNFTDNDLCNICSNEERKQNIICIVEEPLDIINIENTNIYNGLYHCLLGNIFGSTGINTNNIKLTELLNRIKTNSITEIIIATNPNSEGDLMAMYLKKEISTINSNIKISRLATGLPSGSSIEYTDKTTLANSLQFRVDF